VTADDGRPLLFLDVDGVLNPYPDCPPGFAEFELFPGDDEPVRLCAAHGDWLHELSAAFDLVWATAWGEAANRLLCPHFGLPELPSLSLQPPPFDPAAKLAAVAAYASDRPAAWVDDIVPTGALEWVERRSQPTLVLEVDPSVGLTRESVDELLSWSEGITA
jgi:hypothetical protein